MTVALSATAPTPSRIPDEILAESDKIVTG